MHPSLSLEFNRLVVGDAEREKIVTDGRLQLSANAGFALTAIAGELGGIFAEHRAGRYTTFPLVRRHRSLRQTSHRGAVCPMLAQCLVNVIRDLPEGHSGARDVESRDTLRSSRLAKMVRSVRYGPLYSVKRSVGDVALGSYLFFSPLPLS